MYKFFNVPEIELNVLLPIRRTLFDFNKDGGNYGNDDNIEVDYNDDVTSNFFIFIVKKFKWKQFFLSKVSRSNGGGGRMAHWIAFSLRTQQPRV